MNILLTSWLLCMLVLAAMLHKIIDKLKPMVAQAASDMGYSERLFRKAVVFMLVGMMILAPIILMILVIHFLIRKL